MFFLLGSSSMNHYQDNMYNAYSNRLSSIGHLQRSNPTMVNIGVVTMM